MVTQEPTPATAPKRSLGTITLYGITREYEALRELLEESGGEITPEIEDLWNGLGDTLDEKVDGYCSLIRQFTHLADAARVEAKRLNDLAKQRDNAATRLKERLKAHLELMGFTKHVTGRFTVRIQQNSQPSIRWTGEPEQIPFPFRRVVVELDTSAVRDALKAGVDLPEGLEVERGFHLRIA